MVKNTHALRIPGRAWVRLLVAGFLLYIIAAGFGGLQLSMSAIQHARPQYIAVAAIMVALSYAAAATTYVLLSPRRLRFIPTLLTQIAGGLVNRMLPAGLGGMGLNLLYLKKNGHSTAVATAVTASNNLLGFFGNMLLVAGIVVLFPLGMDRIQFPEVSRTELLLVVAVVVGGAVIGLRRTALAAKMQRSAREVGRYLQGCMQRPVRSLLALTSSCLLTALHGLGLYFVLYAVGDPQSFGVALLAVSVGAFVGAATPTPGGLGGAEAGIAGVLIAFSLPASTGIAAALVYRGLTYWLPLLPGYLALRIVEKRYL